MRVLLLSNGHGEDLSGALLGEQLTLAGVSVEAMPLVGLGNAYRQRAIAVVGQTLEISTGGLGYTNRGGQLREIWEGQLTHLLQQLLLLLRRRRRYAMVVAVGDVVPVLGAWLSGRPCAAYLVAYSSHYEGRLRLPWPLGPLLQQRRFRVLWARDWLTARDLSAQLHRPVDFVGNPFFDLVAGPARAPEQERGSARARLLLLPGSRLPEAVRNLSLMLKLLEQLAPLVGAADQPLDLDIQAALVPAMTQQHLQQLADNAGWQRSPDGTRLTWRSCQVALRQGQFAALLQQADLVVSMAGTASEQAVGLGLPVVQLVGAGPQFTAGFAEAQRRLLGQGVVCAPGQPGAAATLSATAVLICDLLSQLRHRGRQAALRARLDGLAQERIGPAGGSVRMSEAILATLPAPEP